MPPVRRLLTLAALVALVPAGCGVPVDTHPRAIDNPHVLRSDEPLGRQRGSPAGSGSTWSRPGRLERVSHRVAATTTPAEQLAELLNGPSEQDSAKGLTSALTTMTIEGMTVTNRRAVVVVGQPPETGARSDEVLAYGQIVCTLTSQGADVGTVSFVSGGEPLAVPRADGLAVRGRSDHRRLRGISCVPDPRRNTAIIRAS